MTHVTENLQLIKHGSNIFSCTSTLTENSEHQMGLKKMNILAFVRI